MFSASQVELELFSLRTFELERGFYCVRYALNESMPETIISRCESLGLRMTDQRRAVAQALENSTDHPGVEELHKRSLRYDPQISIATVYRTLKLFEETGILERLEFRDGKSRYEDAERDHHDHLIDLHTGRVVEFCNDEIEALQVKIARRLGYRLRGHRLELYAVPIDPKQLTARSDDEYQ